MAEPQTASIGLFDDVPQRGARPAVRQTAPVPSSSGGLFDDVPTREGGAINPDATWGEAATDSAKQFGHGVYRGFGEMLKAPGDVAEWALNKVGISLPDAATKPVADFLPEDQSKAVHSVDESLAGANDLPITNMGRYAGRIGEVAGASIAPEALLWAKASKLAGMSRAAVAEGAPMAERTGAWLRNSLQSAGENIVNHPVAAAAGSAASTAGSAVGQQAAADMGYGPTGQFVAGMAGGFAPSVALSAIPSKALANAQLARIEAFEDNTKRLGVRPFMPAASEAPSTSILANVLGNRPVIGAPIQNALHETEQDLAGAAANIAGRMSSTGDVPSIREMGDIARGSIDRFKTAGIKDIDPDALRAIGVNPADQATAGRLVSQGAQKTEAVANAARQAAGEQPAYLNPVSWQRRGASDLSDAELQAILHRPASETSFAAKSEAMYENARRLLPDAIRTNGTRGVDLVATPNTASVLKNIQDSMASNIGGQRTIGGELAQKLINKSSNFSLPDLWSIRTEIGRAIGEYSPVAPGSLRMSELRQLYGAINDDIATGMQTVANRAWSRTQLPVDNPAYLTPQQARQSQTAARAFQVAQRYYRTGMGSIDNMNRVLGSDTPEAAARAIVSAAQDGTRGNIGMLLSMRRSMRPDEWQDVASTVFQELGRPNAGDHAAQLLGYSLTTAAKRWNAMSPSAKNALFGGEQAKDINDFFDIIGSMARYGLGKNHSNSANHLLTAELITGFGGATATGTLPWYLSGLAGGTALSSAMASPSAIKALKSWARFKAGLANRGISMDNPEAARVSMGILGRALRQVPAIESRPQEEFARGGAVKGYANGGNAYDPLTIRQNNPGAVEYAPWMDAYGASVGPDGRYAQFPDAQSGYNVMGKILNTYNNKYGLNTVRGIVSRWAPSNVDNNSTDAYIASVAKKLGIDPDAPISEQQRPALMQAMAGYEAGRAPAPFNGQRSSLGGPPDLSWAPPYAAPDTAPQTTQSPSFLSQLFQPSSVSQDMNGNVTWRDGTVQPLFNPSNMR